MYEGGAEPLGSALLAPLPMPLSSSRLTVRTTVSPLLLCKIGRWVRMRLERAALARRCSHSQRHQCRRLLFDTLAQGFHHFVFVHYGQVTPPGTLCNCFPLPLHVRFLCWSTSNSRFNFVAEPRFRSCNGSFVGASPYDPLQRIFMSFQLNRVGVTPLRPRYYGVIEIYPYGVVGACPYLGSANCARRFWRNSSLVNGTTASLVNCSPSPLNLLGGGTSTKAFCGSGSRMGSGSGSTKSTLIS